LRNPFLVVRSRFAITLAFIAFFQLIGGHWAVLQAGAWMGMVMAYARNGSVSAAISKTFDGKHPCPVCCAVQEGRKQEEAKTPGLQLELKKDFMLRSFHFEVPVDFTWGQYLERGEELLGIVLEPLLPPPRGA
jgi:hypothetical protein